MSTPDAQMTATAARHRATFLLEVALDEARIRERLAKSLREWRGPRAQLDVYAETGFSYRQYQRLENGQSLPRWAKLEELADRIGLDMADIIGDQDERPSTRVEAAAGDAADLVARLEALEREQQQNGELLRELVQLLRDDQARPQDGRARHRPA